MASLARQVLVAKPEQADGLLGEAERVGDDAAVAERERRHRLPVDQGEQCLTPQLGGVVEGGEPLHGRLLVGLGQPQGDRLRTRRGAGRADLRAAPALGGVAVKVRGVLAGDYGGDRIHGVSSVWHTVIMRLRRGSAHRAGAAT
jgi:hypothetical protein